MTESEMVEVAATADRAGVLARWRAGDIVDFAGTEVDQGWIDDIASDGVVERVRFSNCTFVGSTSFAGLRFFDELVDFSFSAFDADVSFVGCAFEAASMVNFSSVRFAGDADFSGTDFGTGAAQFTSAVFEAHASFANATFGSRLDMMARFRADASFKGASLAKGETAFGAARFSGALILDEVHAGESSLVTFRGIHAADPERVSAVTTDVRGDVQVFGDAPAAIAGLGSAPAVGKNNPLKGLLLVSFNAGPLEGRTYGMAGAQSVLGIMTKIGGECSAIVRRTDLEFSVGVVLSGQEVVVTSHTEPAVSKRLLDPDQWRGLDQILQRLEVAEA